ncbi:hypothetical protein HAX54_052380 [Datura stramonium]|uniref:Uncharacterized protein n=1 Tax=Datura stramonium TaxID=4076 RepID=A0ABS8WQT7_DATST|nr:hypothetical protein [Datura stramonium]
MVALPVHHGGTDLYHGLTAVGTGRYSVPIPVSSSTSTFSPYLSMKPSDPKSRPLKRHEVPAFQRYSRRDATQQWRDGMREAQLIQRWHVRRAKHVQTANKVKSYFN